MKIYLMRHSESQDDLINCYGGMADWDLTEGGIKTVEKFRSTFENFGVEKIYTSPLKRAWKTAELLNEKSQISIEKIFELHETPHYGYLTGLEKGLAKELFAYAMDRSEWQNTGYYNRKCFPGGETPDDLDKRVEYAIGKILKDGIGDKDSLRAIAIVAHGGVIRSFFWNVLKDKRKITDIKDVACAEIIFDEGKFKLVKCTGFEFED